MNDGLAGLRNCAALESDLNTLTRRELAARLEVSLAPGNIFLGDCDYAVPGSDRRYVYRVYQGRMRITVYEARTARAVASLTMDGRKRPQCESIRFIHQNEPQTEEWDTVPEEPAYAQLLSPLVNGKTRR